MIANIQGGVSMISELSTVIGFLSLVIVKILDFITPLDCLGYQKKMAGTETDWLLCPFYVYRAWYNSVGNKPITGIYRQV